MGCTYYFLKKKKVEMWQWHCRNRTCDLLWKYCGRDNFFLLFHRFRNIFFFSFSTMALPQLPNFFFPPGQQNGQKELRQYYYRNSTKVGERKIKSRKEKFLIFGNGITAIPSAHSAVQVGTRNVSAHKENQMSKKMLRNLWKSKKKLSRPQYFYNIFTINHR